MIRIEAGKLRQRIDIQEQDTSKKDDFGNPIREPWKTIETRSAEVIPMTGREFFQAEQVDSRVTHRVTIRFMSNVTTSNRILYRNRILNIISVRDVDERRWQTEIMVMENTGTAKA